MQADENLSVEKAEHPKKIILDYGGPNVAKPLHVGHLRSAIIGESIKRLGRFMGHEMIGDVHLGDWGLQMGLIITELRERKPDLVYFDESYTGEYPEEPPFTISELEEIYPTASGKSKEDEAYKESCHAGNLSASARSQRISGYLKTHPECIRNRLEEELRTSGCIFLISGKASPMHSRTSRIW